MSQSTSIWLAEPNPFEDQIESFEQEVQEKYYAATQNLQTVALSDRFNRLLELRIIPTLKRIGFDEQFCLTLFKMSAPAWKLIEQICDDIELVYPILRQNIAEIRKGVIASSRKNSRKRSILGEMDPQATHQMVSETMHPVNLLEDCHDISLS